jgi:hypothetical protein
MALTITDELIRSSVDTRHTAELVHSGTGDAWRVSWLPGQRLVALHAAVDAAVVDAVLAGDLLI